MLIPGRGFLHGQLLTLSNSQIKNLPNIGLTAIVSPGPDRVVIIQNASAYFKIVVPYDDPSVSSVLGYLTYENVDGDVATEDQFNLYGSAGIFVAHESVFLLAGTLNEASVVAHIVNQPVIFSIYIDDSSGGSSLTGGSDLNTGKVSINYLIFNTLTGQFE